MVCYRFRYSNFNIFIILGKEEIQQNFGLKHTTINKVANICSGIWLRAYLLCYACPSPTPKLRDRLALFPMSNVGEGIVWRLSHYVLFYVAGLGLFGWRQRLGNLYLQKSCWTLTAQSMTNPLKRLENVLMYDKCIEKIRKCSNLSLRFENWKGRRLRRLIFKYFMM